MEVGTAVGTRPRLEPGGETGTGRKRERKWREGEGEKIAQEFATQHDI